ncbi:MAG TPA: excinuclease ABC subunit UvrC [Bacteroidia bacterium]|jgi:excinuclease ABC subunit C|nr:excinuclease ABC subunit UvrC [Bacteroidia bacterium]
MEIKEILRATLSSLPDSPGVYQYYDKDGEIIYVGKAKNLKKRVSSYFQKNHDTGKLYMLVRRIEKINYIVVKTEWDALLLENSLIKKHQPRYNVMLKDDKTYPWICLKKEPFPRIFSTRKIYKDGSEYFGPYASVKVMYAMLELVRRLYPLRTCNLVLTEENIQKKKFKKCLEYHIGNCKGPCEGLQTKADYDDAIIHIRQILKGNIQGSIRLLKEEIERYAANLEFEKAHELKERMEMLEKYQSKSMVVSPTIDNVDVFSILTDEKSGYVNYLKVMNGAIVQSHTIELSKKLDETPEELLLLGIAELRLRFESHSPEIIIPFETESEVPNAIFFVPQKGDKKRLLELSENNLRYYIKEKEMQENLKSPKTKTEALLEQMKKDLRLKEPPVHIECFDNSNIQGAFPVAAMTVFKDGKPSKKDYRHFNIRTVEGPDDFASMEEVIYRRYKRAVNENEPLPQLIVIDGGKGQLSSAMESLTKLGLENKVAVIGIAKRLEEIFFPDDPIPLYLDKRSQTLRIIQQIRDEAHRFGITHHRKRRSKGAIKSALTDIKGIGEKTTQKLLSQFGSLERIQNATQEDIANVIGEKNALLVKEALTKKEGKPIS